jgi:hypothetical protein
MRDPSPQRGLVLSVLALALALVAAMACSGGPESPTAPAVSSGGGSGGSSGGSGGGTGGGGTGGGDGGTGGGGGGTGGGGGGTGEGGGGTGGAGTRGNLGFYMTDAPIDDILELWVYIAELKVKPADGPVERFPATQNLFDLLTLQDGVTGLLGQDEVEAGTYQFIEFLLDEELSYVIEELGGEPIELKIPSEKIKVKGAPFDVPADATTSVLIDFDAEKSLKTTGKGRYQLKPFVSIMEVTVTE